MRLGIIGLPYVGKSTIFSCLTRAKGSAGSRYAFADHVRAWRHRRDELGLGAATSCGGT
jgi:hypothetical protein